VSVRATSHRDLELVGLVLAARAGDSFAWTTLIRRFDTTLRRIAGSYTLTPADVDDIVQARWLDLLQQIERLREPAAIAGWLDTVTRHHALRLLRARRREHLTVEPACVERSDVHGPEASALASERDAALARALARLSRRRELRALRDVDPPLTVAA
jgi:RNA polymerase sigma factor (sigma-70 family)